MKNKDELIQIVGTENVLDDPEILEAYSRDNSFAAPRKPRLVVKPGTSNEVQGIVEWANRTLTPLVPVSSGPPRFRGDTVPSLGGAVIVDLSEMRKIIKIDRRNRLTHIEPGVTYSQIQPELAKEGMRLTTPLLPRGNKSVIASLLEREPRLVPRYQWTLIEPLRCLEVVWGSGEGLLTGDAGGYKASLEEQMGAQASPHGPGQTDFYRFISASQGSMAIATWASIKCELLPSIRKLFFVPAERLNDLIGFAYRLLRVRIGDELLLLNSSNLASILGQGGDQIGALMEELPRWVLIIGVAGRERLPKERVEWQVKDISDIAQQFGVRLASAIPGARDGEVLERLLNPSREPYWKLDYKGGCQDIFFLTTLNRTPEFIETMYSASQALGYSPSEIGIYIQPQHLGVSCHCEFSLPYDPSNPREVSKTQRLLTEVSATLLNQGAFFSRPYGIWADMVYNRDAQATMALKKLKGIFDPNNVMNPGKLCF